MKIPIEELERFYGDRALLDLIKDMIELEKKYPSPTPLEKLPSCYI